MILQKIPAFTERLHKFKADPDELEDLCQVVSHFLRIYSLRNTNPTLR
jgi:hypothetical protein